MHRYVAVTQRKAGGRGGGEGGSGEMNGVLVEGVEDGVAGPTVAHVHDAERRLHARRRKGKLFDRRSRKHGRLGRSV